MQPTTTEPAHKKSTPSTEACRTIAKLLQLATAHACVRHRCPNLDLRQQSIMKFKFDDFIHSSSSSHAVHVHADIARSIASSSMRTSLKNHVSLYGEG